MPDPNDLDRLSRMAEEIAKRPEKPQGPSPQEVRRALRSIPFDDLTVEQKFERTREIVKDMNRSLSYLRQQLQGLERRQRSMENHDHANGKVLVPANEKCLGDMCGGEAQAATCEGYF